MNTNWGRGSTPSRQEGLNSWNKDLEVKKESQCYMREEILKAFGVAGSKIKSRKN